MDIASRSEGGCLVVELQGRLDAAAAPDLDSFCEKRMAAGGGSMLIDLAQLEYISSAGLRTLLALAKQLGNKGGGLALARPTGLVKTVLTVSGFGTLIPVEETIEGALARIQ